MNERMTYEQWTALTAEEQNSVPDEKLPEIPQEQLRNKLTRAICKRVNGEIGWELTQTFSETESSTKWFPAFTLRKVMSQEIWYKLDPTFGTYTMNLTGAEPSLEEEPIGTYGMKWMNFMQEQYPDLVLSAPCKVTGYVTNDPFHAFTIGQGSADGLALYDPVVTDLGLVGVITSLGEHSAEVTTILSPNVSVAAYCSTTKDHGVVTGTVADALEDKCRLQYLEKETAIRQDKVILTSGENGMFPKGYVIGYVREVQMDDTGLTAAAVLEPASEITDLSMVIVIKDFDGKGRERHD